MKCSYVHLLGFAINFLGIYSLRCDEWKCASIEMPKNGTCVNPVQIKDSQFYTFHVGFCPNDNERCIEDETNSIESLEEIRMLEENLGRHPPSTWSCKPKLVEKELPGEPCKQNSECLSNTCQTTCIGLAEKETCKSSNDCNAGLYCDSNNVCKNLINTGDEGCQNDFDCQNDSGCQDSSKKCIKYFSLKNGVSSNNAKLCESNFISNGICWDTSLLNESLHCDEDQDHCLYSILGMGMNFTKACECSLVDKNCRFCPLPTTDQLYLDYLDALKDILESNKESHSLNRFKSRTRMQAKKMLIKDFPKYKEIDKCVESLFIRGDFITMNTLIMIVLLVLGLF